MTIKKVKIMFWIASHLPKTLVYYCVMHVMAHATTGKYSETDVTELTMLDAVKRYHKDMGIK